VTLEEFEKDSRFYHHDGVRIFPFLGAGGQISFEVCVEILSMDRREDGEVIGGKLLYRRVERPDIWSVNVMEPVGEPFRVVRDIFTKDGITAGVTSLAE